MSERDGYPQGTPSWTDLATSDAEAARAFYGRLLGWEWEVSGPEFGHYGIASLRGRRVAGAAARMNEAQPVAWLTYLAVDDADKVAAAIPGAGGTVLMSPVDVADQGRMAIAADPTGAAFGLWQAGSHRGAELVNEPGTVVWNELVTSDLAAATAFYEAVLGVSFTDLPYQEVLGVSFTDGSGGEASIPTYKMLTVGGRTAGGAMPLEPGQDGVPPHWRVYFEVADTDATVATAQELGARVVLPVTSTPQGPMAILADPQGGTFAVIASGSTE